jgi:hypothetical protein
MKARRQNKKEKTVILTLIDPLMKYPPEIFEVYWHMKELSL